MEKSLFFNALPNAEYPTGYDRNYDANDISDWLSAFISTGVVKTINGLKIVADTGLNIKVNSGKAVINGKPYVNDNFKSFVVPTAPTIATARKDAIVLRFSQDVSTRSISLVYIQGDADGSIPKIYRNSMIYDLMLGYISVGQDVTTIVQANITDLRGDSTAEVQLIGGGTSIGYCPYTTAVKGYEDYYDAIIERFRDYTQVVSLTRVVTTTMASRIYNPATDLVSVLVNGEAVKDTQYTLDKTGAYVEITFTFDILASQEVTLIIDKAYDGEGLPNVLEDYLDLKQQVENMTSDSEYVYTCNGSTDNVQLSEIASTFLNGGTDRNVKHIRVVGTWGMTAPNSGLGSQAEPFVIMDLGLPATTNRRITFDFSNCSAIMPTLQSDKYYIMFGGFNVSIIGGVFSLGGGYSRMFNSVSGDVKADGSRFIVIGLSNSYISSTGTFTNCYADVTNMSGASYAYWVQSNSLIKLFGGEHYAYGISGQNNGVVYLTAGLGGASIQGANFPQVARSGFIQTNYVFQSSGGGYVTANGAISSLATVTTSGLSFITGTIRVNKPNLG